MGTALLTLTLTSAYADGSNSVADGGVSNVLNGQVNFNSQQSTLNLTTNEVAGNVSGGSVTGGNAVDVMTMNNTNVTNNQYVGGVNIGADTYATVSNVAGTTDLQSQAVCNSASISLDPTSTNVNTTQECNATDSSATMHANVSNTLNDVTLAASAVGNTMEEDTSAPLGNITNAQINHSAVNSSTTTNTSFVSGNVNASASSIGNNAEIIHYSTGN